MLYYDLMVKLSNTDMGTLFNLTAELERVNREEELRMKMIDKYPKLNTAKNLHETLVDTYLLHFLGEMDPKMAGKSGEYLEMLDKGKTDSKDVVVDHLGKLESMRELMKKKNKSDTDKSNQNLKILMGNMVKRKILQKKSDAYENAGSLSKLYPFLSFWKENPIVFNL